MSAPGHALPSHSAPVPANVRYCPKATKSQTCRDCPLSAIRRHCTVDLFMAGALAVIRSSGSSTRSSNVVVSPPVTINSQLTILPSSNSHPSGFGYAFMSPRPSHHGRLQPTSSQSAGRDVGKRPGDGNMPSASMAEVGGRIRIGAKGSMPANRRLLHPLVIPGSSSLALRSV